MKTDKLVVDDFSYEINVDFFGLQHEFLDLQKLKV